MDNLLDRVRHLVEANAHREARDLLADVADRWVQAGSFTEIDSLLREAAPASISVAACLTLLAVTKRVAGHLGARLAFAERVRDALTSTVGEARTQIILKNLV
jgi:hypothetical protein